MRTLIMRKKRDLAVGLLSTLLVVGLGLAQDSKARVEITVQDKKTDKPTPCRLHLLDRAGKPQRAGALPFWRDHFVCPGTVQLELAPGDYTYEVERGPEYTASRGTFTVKGTAPVQITVKLERLAVLASEGWWSGELHVHRPLAEIELLMQAEDLHVAPVITWWHNRRGSRTEWGGTRRLPEDPLVRFDHDRYYHVLAGEDERAGGALLYFHLRQPLEIASPTAEYPSALKLVAEARRHKGWIDIEKPFWWDVPVWLASGQIDSIGLANNHMNRSQMSETEAWGKPRDTNRLSPPRGNGFWTQEIYYHILNCGLRVPPSAGSASGVLPNPVGYNRVYARVEGEFSYEKWWDALGAGRVFVTNGPLLRTRVNGQWPGHVFSAPEGKAIELEVKAALTGRDEIKSLEIIKNGRVERTVPFEEWSKSGTLGKVRFHESGWLLVRTIAENPKTFRFASTAPYYVEIGGAKQRISKASVQFFVDWVEERMKLIQLEDPMQREEVLRHHLAARKFWGDLLARANAE
jgi:hypothetical protein